MADIASVDGRSGGEWGHAPTRPERDRVVRGCVGTADEYNRGEQSHRLTLSRELAFIAQDSPVPTDVTTLMETELQSGEPPPLRTRFTEILGLSKPIMSAPMGDHSGGRLAAAVSKAGGLGTFGGSNAFGPDWLRQQIALIRGQTERPFGVGFITQLIEPDPTNFEIALEERVPVIVFSFTDPQPWLERAKDAGAITICQVQSVELAEMAMLAGADVLLAQGNEAGGHTGQMSLLPLLVDLVERYPDALVLAAGAITSGRALAAVLAAGAQGASLGTALLATPEAVEVPRAFKERIILSHGQDTAYTRLYDLLGDTPWPEGIAARVYRNRFVREWDGRTADILAHREELSLTAATARTRQDPEVSSVYAGQGAGHVKGIRPAGEVVQEICDAAARILQQWVQNPSGSP